jgi:hypothetical protein
MSYYNKDFLERVEWEAEVYYESYWDRMERQAEEGEKAEFERKAKIAAEWLKNAKAGQLYTFRFCVMDGWSYILRKDFDDYSKQFIVDPTLGMVYLGKTKRRWKKGLRSLQFLATGPWGDVAVVWMDEEQLESLCEYKQR